MQSKKYLNSREFVDNNAKRMPICIVVDCSESMKEYDGTSKTRIDRVNDGLALFYEKLRNNRFTKYSVEVLLIQVGNNAKVFRDFSLTDSNPTKLNYLMEKNNLTEGVSLALDKIDERKEIYKAACIGYYQPWLIIMSDGGLNQEFSKNDFRMIQQEVRDREFHRRLSVFPVYVQGKPFWDNYKCEYTPIKPEAYEDRLKLMSEFSRDGKRFINVDLTDKNVFDNLFKYLYEKISHFIGISACTSAPSSKLNEYIGMDLIDEEE